MYKVNLTSVFLCRTRHTCSRKVCCMSQAWSVLFCYIVIVLEALDLVAIWIYSKETLVPHTRTPIQKLGTSDVSKWCEGGEEELQHSSQGELCYLSDVTEQEERRRWAIATSVVFCENNLWSGDISPEKYVMICIFSSLIAVLILCRGEPQTQTPGLGTRLPISC